MYNYGYILEKKRIYELFKHMKLKRTALLMDLHWGVWDDNINHYENYKLFYDEIFFPYLIKNKIDTVFILGDIFDRRKYTNNLTLYNSMVVLFDRLKEMGIAAYAVVGNHDMYYPEKIKPEAISLFLKKYSNVCIIDKPVTMDVGGQDVCFIPWICKENEKECFDEMKNSIADICFTHNPIVGFSKHYKSSDKKDGHPPELWSNFKLVVSGHYHYKCDEWIGETYFIYPGTAFQTSIDDLNADNIKKGFHIFVFPPEDDPYNWDWEFVENPNHLYHYIKYTEGCEIDPDSKMFTDCRGKIVYILQKKKEHLADMEHYMRFIAAIRKNKVLDLQISFVKAIPKNVSFEDYPIYKMDITTTENNFFDTLSNLVFEGKLDKYFAMNVNNEFLSLMAEFKEKHNNGYLY